MGILGLCGSRSAGLYGSGVACLKKVWGVLAGDWSSAWASGMLRAIWHVLENSVSREDRWGKAVCMVPAQHV